MRINDFCTEEEILKELGERIKNARIKQNMTQNQLAKNSGIGKSTIERAENGESIQFLNIIKILKVLHCIHLLDMILPSTEPTPMQYLYSKEPKPRQRYRAHIVSENTPPYKASESFQNGGEGATTSTGFIWEEDK